MEINPMPIIMSIPKAIREAPVRSWTWMISDECGILEEIEITHFPDGRDIDVPSILSIINNILKDCVVNSSLEDSKDDEEFVDGVVQHEIHKLSPKLAYMSSEEGDLHEKTIDVFKMLSNYPWEAKLTLALAALVTNYGEYWVIAQSNPKGELTKMMKFLRQMGENIPAQQSRFHVLHDLMESMSDMIKGILKIKEFMLSTDDETTISIATTIIVIASYWTVRSIVTSAPYIHSLFAEDYEPSAPKERELVIMTRKIRALLECLQNHEKMCGEVQHAVHETDDVDDDMEKQYREIMSGFEEDHADNMWILNFLFNPKGNNDSAPIVDCSTNQGIELESFKKKNVMLMISSDIDDTSKTTVRYLAKMWKCIHSSNMMPDRDEFKMIWFPIVEQWVEWTESMQHKFEEIRCGMPLYSTNNPRHIHPTAIKFVKEKFHFKKHTMIVGMDGVGKILDPNLIHLFCSWPIEAFPLTVEREAYFSRNRTRALDIQNLFWSVGGDLRAKLFLYVIGGDDMELIQKLVSKINALDKSYQTNSTILYIGKSSGCRKNISRLEMGGDKERRHNWEDDDGKKWLFWARVESMLINSDDNEAKVIKKLLSYDKNGETWMMFYYRSAFFSTDGEVVRVFESGCVIDDGLIMLEAIPKAAEYYGGSEFVEELEEHCKKLRATSPSHVYGCSRLEFHTETVPDSIIKCVECGNSMEKCIALLCCHHDQQPS